MQISGKYDAKQARDHLLEQYKLMRESIDDTTADRQVQSRFASTISTAILGAVVFITLNIAEPEKAELRQIAWMVCAIASFFGATTMWMLGRYLRQCGKVIKIKYRTLKAMERRLPSAPFYYEGRLRGAQKLNVTLVITNFAWVCTAIFAVLVLVFVILVFWPDAITLQSQPNNVSP